jgi:hypothetical protein
VHRTRGYTAVAGGQVFGRGENLTPGIGNRDADRGARAIASVGCALVKTRQNDPHAATVVLPPDQLAARRAAKSASPPPLSVEQVQRLLAAAEARRKPDRRE